MTLLTVVHVYVVRKYLSNKQNHINSTTRLSDIWNVISVKLCLIILMVCIQLRDMNVRNVLPVILNVIRVDYTVQSKGQWFHGR